MQFLEKAKIQNPDVWTRLKFKISMFGKLKAKNLNFNVWKSLNQEYQYLEA